VENKASMKVTLPDTYDENTSKLGDWLFQVKNYVVLVRIPAEHHVNFAVILLRGTALSWWRLVAEISKSPYEISHLRKHLDFLLERGLISIIWLLI
jgi:hypothetical protein